MISIFKIVFFLIFDLCVANYNEEYRVPLISSDKLESYVFNDKEYLIQNFPVNWENAKIVCRGQHNGTLAVLDTREKAEFMAEVLSELHFSIDAVWVGARRESSEDPEGYRWNQGLELQRTAADVLANEGDDYNRHYPIWLNRTHVPVPAGGADCVALERVQHDAPVFMDLPCDVRRAFACEREVQKEIKIHQVSKVRCREGLYRVYDGRLDWRQAAAYCVMRSMALAKIRSLGCLKKVGLTMLKSRPSIENAWVGARGISGSWSWIDNGENIFSTEPYTVDSQPPIRHIKSMKQNGCLQIDRHESRTPVFIDARCERKMQFICYQSLRNTPTQTTSDDNYQYVLVREPYNWQHAVDNCRDQLNGTLASVERGDTLMQLLLVMGESEDEPVEHIWISGHLRMSRDMVTDVTSFSWFNAIDGKRIPDPKSADTNSLYMPPWLDDDFTMDSPCLNLDRQDHLNGVVYGLPCDTLQYSICMIEKPIARQLNVQTTEKYETTI